MSTGRVLAVSVSRTGQTGGGMPIRLQLSGKTDWSDLCCPNICIPSSVVINHKFKWYRLEWSLRTRKYRVREYMYILERKSQHPSLMWSFSTTIHVHPNISNYIRVCGLNLSQWLLKCLRFLWWIIAQHIGSGSWPCVYNENKITITDVLIALFQITTEYIRSAHVWELKLLLCNRWIWWL